MVRLSSYFTVFHNRNVICDTRSSRISRCHSLPLAVLILIMEKSSGWEQLGEMLRMLQAFRHLYLRGEAENDHDAVQDWRHALFDFLKVRSKSRTIRYS